MKLKRLKSEFNPDYCWREPVDRMPSFISIPQVDGDRVSKLDRILHRDIVNDVLVNRSVGWVEE